VSVSDAIARLVEKAERIGCQKCGTTVDVSAAEAFATVQCGNCGARFTVPAKFGQFLLIQPLSQEGSAMSFRARDRTLGRQVVVKLIADESSGDPTVAQRFHEGARTLAALNHPNVLKVYSVGEERGAPYIVMEMVGGDSLDKTLAAGQAMDEASALRMAVDTAEGLRAAFSVGMVHGDVRPGNIVFGHDGLAKVMDFRLEWSDDRRRELERVLAHPDHVAPESVQGVRGDHRADIYSLGATLFHALTGRLPFSGPTPAETVKARITGETPDVRQIDPMIHSDAAEIVARMMARNPAQRYQSYDEVVNDLSRAQQHASSPAAAAPVESLARTMAAQPRRRKKLPAWVGLAAVAGVVAVLGALLWAASFLVSGPGASAPPFRDEFSGPALDKSWVGVGSAGRFVDNARFHLVQSGAGGDAGLRRTVGRGDFQTIVKFNHIEWNPDLICRARVIVNDQNGNSLIVSLMKEQRNPAVLRVVDQRNNRTNAKEDKTLVIDPAAVTFRIIWQESQQTWRVMYGLDGNAPVEQHPLSPIETGYSSTPRRVQQVSISAEAGEGFFDADLDEYELKR
jgi:Protein kinase domain